MVWLKEQIPPTEEGQLQWTQIVEWVNGPPARLPAAESSPSATSRVAVSRPEVLPADAPTTADAEAAAFAAFQGMVG